MRVQIVRQVGTGGPGDSKPSPFAQIKRTNAAGNEFWSSRDFSRVLGYTDYRNFEQVIDKATMACFNSGQRPEDHFVDVTEMIEIGSAAQRPVDCGAVEPRDGWPVAFVSDDNAKVTP